MIKSNELRLGNLVSINSEEPEFLKIEGIKTYDEKSDYSMVRLESFDKWTSLNEILPILLTEEWLLRMGGRKINQIDWEISIRGIKFNCRFNKKWYSSIGGIYLSDKNQYVHQIQNLVHALTNEELIITDNHAKK